MVDPAEALRTAMTLSAVLGYASEPQSAEEATEILVLKVRQRGW